MNRSANREVYVTFLSILFSLVLTACGPEAPGAGAVELDSENASSVESGKEALIGSVTHYRVIVSWKASAASDLAGYKIYRNGIAIAAVAGKYLSYSDTTVQPSTTYSYQVAAYDIAGNSSPKVSVGSVTTPAVPSTCINVVDNRNINGEYMCSNPDGFLCSGVVGLYVAPASYCGGTHKVARVRAFSWVGPQAITMWVEAQGNSAIAAASLATGTSNNAASLASSKPVNVLPATYLRACGRMTKPNGQIATGCTAWALGN